MSGFVAGRPFAQKMRPHRRRVECVGPQSVDRLGRERDQPTGAEQPRRPRDR